MSERSGKAKEVVGWVTGDREVEAQGRVEQEVADPDEAGDDVTSEAVADKTLEVRREHGEYDSDK
jgi:uncharacterized protein YjbJ (UPF0337 family)